MQLLTTQESEIDGFLSFRARRPLPPCRDGRSLEFFFHYEDVRLSDPFFLARFSHHLFFGGFKKDNSSPSLEYFFLPDAAKAPQARVTLSSIDLESVPLFGGSSGHPLFSSLCSFSPSSDLKLALFP